MNCAYCNLPLSLARWGGTVFCTRQCHDRYMRAPLAGGLGQHVDGEAGGTPPLTATSIGGGGVTAPVPATSSQAPCPGGGTVDAAGSKLAGPTGRAGSNPAPGTGEGNRVGSACAPGVQPTGLSTVAPLASSDLHGVVVSPVTGRVSLGGERPAKHGGGVCCGTTPTTSSQFNNRSGASNG